LAKTEFKKIERKFRMSASDDSTARSPLDYGKIALAIALVIGGLAFFYMTIGKQADWLRGVVVVVGLLAGIGVFLTSNSGKSLITFFRAAYNELLRVVWPTRKETTQMTLVVFGFVVIMSIFLWVVDKTLEYALFDLLLGWRK
jgi:preprotein translocase subunit SecE